MVNLDDLIAGMAKSVAHMIREDIRVSVVPSSEPGNVMADLDEFRHALMKLMNLIVNARDAMPQGGDLTVKTANVDLDEKYVRQHLEASAGPHVVVSVSDTGVGMDR